MSIVTYILLAALHAGINSRFNPVVCPFSLLTPEIPPHPNPDSRRLRIPCNRRRPTRLCLHQARVLHPKHHKLFTGRRSCCIRRIQVCRVGHSKIFSFSLDVNPETFVFTLNRVIFTLIAGFLGLHGPLWTLIFIYAFLANAFFLVCLFFLLYHILWSFLNAFQLRSLRTVILPDPSSIPATHATATVTHAQRRRRIAFLLMEAVIQVFYGWLECECVGLVDVNRFERYLSVLVELHFISC
jgi:hypothetical protein